MSAAPDNAPAIGSPNVPYDAYANMPGVRASRLKHMIDSPLHYLAKEDHDTASRVFLRAVHMAVLEPHRFPQTYAVWQGGDRRGKPYKAFVARNKGKAILTRDECERVFAIGMGMYRHPVAGPLLMAPGECEKTIAWRHPGTLLPCKARLDKQLGYTIIDIKTYGTSHPRRIGSKVAQLGAHIQAAHYVEGLSITLGCDPKRLKYLIISAEDRSPYDVAVMELEHDGALALGRSERERLMRLVERCTRENHWPGRCPEIEPLVLPPWADPSFVDANEMHSSEDS